MYKDPFGGLSILMVDTLTVKVLMTNATFVSLFLLFVMGSSKLIVVNFNVQQRQLNAEKFIVSPDLKYVLLLADSTQSTSRLIFDRFGPYIVHPINLYV